MRSRFLSVLPLFLLASRSLAGPHDWPQWQGIDRTAVSREKGLLQEWPKDGPTMLWKAEGIGESYCTPTVASGRIFVMGNRERKECVIALSEKDGKELWSYNVGDVRHNGGGYAGPRCSPTVDENRLYALGLNGDLVCLDTASGKLLWRKDLVKDFKGGPGGWGYSESPLVDGDKLLCTPGGRTATLVALDKKTGETIWKGPVPQGDGAHYSSIIAASVEGQRQYIQFLSGGVVGLSDEGKFLWRYDQPHNGTANCSTPIYHNGHVFAASGYGTGGGLAKLIKNGDKWEAKQVYFTKDMKNHHGGMVLVDGKLYGSNEGELVCLDFMSGEVLWRERQPGKGSISCADGRLYYRNEGGPMFLVEANEKKYVKCGQFSPPRSGAPAWPHPVIANGRLYIQDQDKLMCYDVKQR
jgi:outer membrane protein assembly factor BamB